jgi:pimeloyl-ACP methyl ester carboxylesterase
MLASVDRLETAVPVTQTGGLAATLAVPPQARGVILFAHGGGSTHHSPRNRHVAAALQEARFATCLVDLVTPEERRAEARSGRPRYRIPILVERLGEALDWLQGLPDIGPLPVGCFGASSGAAVALGLAALRPASVRGVVCRGGRPELAGALLTRVQAPVLLIVGERDAGVLAANVQAFEQLCAPKDLAVVPGAGHLFEEPGALDEVARLALGWFLLHLRA